MPPPRLFAPLIRLALLAGTSVALTSCTLFPGDAPHITQAPDRVPVTLQTQQGPVTGVHSAEGRAFLGIPFAAPPVGALRWREPQPPAHRTTPLDASRPRKGCLQNLDPRAMDGRPSAWMLAGSEDCLHLNIYTPADVAPGERLPVMVWLYGGGLVLGENNHYDLSRLAQRQRVIAVAPNYRVGPMGFFTLPALRAETGGRANLGLLDQQAALRWVQANIAQFGGDPQRVTLFGESAGSWSVCYQLTAPATAGLFQRAILQSGVCILPQATPPLDQADAGAQQLAAELGCPAGNDQLACLRRLPTRTLGSARSHTPGMFGPDTWGPVWGDASLPEPPAQAIASGRFHQVPILEGINTDEGRLFGHMYRAGWQVRTVQDYRQRVERLFGARAPWVLAAYPPGRFADPAEAMGQTITDGIFECPALRFEQMASAYTALWAYRFADPDPARNPLLGGLSGAFHSAEIVYVLQSPWVLASPTRFTPDQQALADRMQGAWAAFARDGDPGLANWPRVTPRQMQARLFAPGAAEADGLTSVQPDNARCAPWR